MERTEIRLLYKSPNGDAWFLGRDPTTGAAFVRHEANIPSGGHRTDIEIDAFLNGPRNPEHEALLRLIGGLIPDTQRANARGDRLADERRIREWSDAELSELGNMLLRGLSIGEIARRLRRDRGDVRGKVAEVGRACRRGGSVSNLEPAKVFEDRISPGEWRVEKIDKDGGIEVAIFAGPHARSRAFEYAGWRYSGEPVDSSPMRAR
jgi:hypothetical protein